VPNALTTLAGLLGLSAASALAISDRVPLLTDVLIGAGAGAIAGKLVSTRLERRRGTDLDARRVRQLDLAWTLAGVAFALLANAVIAIAAGLS
jgi:outer membrane lipoprotein SlyB